MPSLSKQIRKTGKKGTKKERTFIKGGKAMKVEYTKPTLVMLMQNADVLCASPQDDNVVNVWDKVKDDIIFWE